MSEIPRFYPNGPVTDLLCDERTQDRIYLNLSGEMIHLFASFSAPKNEQIIKMLGELRCHFKCSQAYLAAFLGVPIITLRRWERNERRPSGAARKFIWFLHALLLQTEDIRSHRDIAAWGRELGTLELSKFLATLGASGEADKEGDEAPEDSCKESP